MNIAGMHIVVVGLGRSGIAAANLCLDRSARVLANDIRPKDQATPQMLALANRGAELALGSHEAVPWDRADLVVISPGVPPFPMLQTVQNSGREVIGELELASRFLSAPIALIGGTNGKSTVTSWLGEMLSLGPQRLFVGGNLGTPLSEVVHEELDLVVLEISSFQAERIPTLHPCVAALLNLSDDHLDRYPDFEGYAQAKGNMFPRMTGEDTAVIPAGDAACGKQASRGGARLVTFGPGGDVRVEGDQLVDSIRGHRFLRRDIRLKGGHNELNACAAVAMAGALDGSEEHIRRALESFEGLRHRTNLVTEIQGVNFYNDSKGTNVGAAVAALRGLREAKAVLIAGGRDKQGSYEPLVEALKDRGRALVVIGEAAERIADAASDCIFTVRAESMRHAVQLAWEHAKAGDAVLLSPACSSFDMFRNYQERGDAFDRVAKQLALEVSPARRAP